MDSTIATRSRLSGKLSKVPLYVRMILNNGKMILNGCIRMLALRRTSLPLLKGLPFSVRGHEYGQRWRSHVGQQNMPGVSGNETAAPSLNPLRTYFDSNKEGRGIWKWNHYFDIYHRHFSKFSGCEVHVLEIGVYSGGSLKMWREYFGQNCRVYGVDIEGACKAYQDDWTKVFIGDQADPEFWKLFKKEVPVIDIVIDDGGHELEQQIVTLEELLPHLRPGGVYLCEDVHGDYNRFSSYVQGLATYFNSYAVKSFDRDQGYVACRTEFQSSIHSIHLYPFVVVIERNDSPVEQFTAPRHGTQWQPWL